ncbi:unknown [Bacteroides sp. CAG:709]|nr:unknown [Bacteroides sp. CAG:709]
MGFHINYFCLKPHVWPQYKVSDFYGLDSYPMCFRWDIFTLTWPITFSGWNPQMKTRRISLWADRQANLIPASFYKNFLWPLREFIYVNLSEGLFHRVKSLYAFG